MRSTYDPHYLVLISRLRRARKAKRLSQEQLAALLRRPQSFISKVETGQRRLDVLETSDWCRALGLSLLEVLPSEVTNTLKSKGPADGHRNHDPD